MSAQSERLAAAENELREARGAWYESLPELVGSVACSSCGAGEDWRDLVMVEEGYSRFTACSVEDGVLMASTDGWDDMSEGGEVEYVQCQRCMTNHRVPSGLEWS